MTQLARACPLCKTMNYGHVEYCKACNAALPSETSATNAEPVARRSVEFFFLGERLEQSDQDRERPEAESHGNQVDPRDEDVQRGK